MLNQTDLLSLKKGDSLNHFFVVRKSEIRLTKTNKQFLYLDIGDHTLTVNANIWDNFEKFSSEIKPGIVVKIKGIMDEFQGNVQIKVTAARLAKPEDGVNPADFLAHSK